MPNAWILPSSSCSCSCLSLASCQMFLRSVGTMIAVAATALALIASVVFVEVSMQRYTPDNNRDIFSLLVDSDQGKHIRVRYPKVVHTNETRKRLLFCTMLSNEFSKYASGAAKLAEAVRRDMPLLSSRLNLDVEIALLEMAERPVPPKIWQALRESGWQRKITRPR